MATLLYRDKLQDCFAAWKAGGTAVIAPAANGTAPGFREVERADEADLELQLTRTTLKELFFPRTEPMLSYHIGNREIETTEFEPPDRQRIIFGARACDAAAMAVDDRLFGWDYRDRYWFERRDRTVIFTQACTTSDDFCMCTSLGLVPDSAKGSDVLLRPLASGTGWQAEAVSERGKEALATVSDHLGEGDEPLAPPAEVPVRFDIEACRPWLSDKENFESPFWREISERCIGCGSCTYLCPTCHCFDIQDEGDTYHGIRRKNWDSCSFPLFTMHTSGHNPRSTRAARWRQRIMHKFSYFEGRFQTHSCTGCGRCTRECPVDMGITETMQAISALQKRGESA